MAKTRAQREEVMKDWPKGCARPSGYVDFFEWAGAQHLHGLRQTKCKRCGLYCFPQEAATHVCSAQGKDGKP